MLIYIFLEHIHGLLPEWDIVEILSKIFLHHQGICGSCSTCKPVAYHLHLLGGKSLAHSIHGPALSVHLLCIGQYTIHIKNHRIIWGIHIVHCLFPPLLNISPFEISRRQRAGTACHVYMKTCHDHHILKRAYKE